MSIAIERMLCDHTLRPTPERVKDVHPLDLDMRQDAAIDFYRYLMEQHEEANESFPELVAQYPDVARRRYRLARSKAYRTMLGRTGARRGDLVSIEEYQERWRGLIVREIDDLVHKCTCDWQLEENCFAWIDESGELHDRYMRSPPRVREAICTMIQVYELLEQDRPIPNKIYTKLARMRKDTGLPLDIQTLRETHA